MSADMPVKAFSVVPPLDHADRNSPVRHTVCRDTGGFDAATQWHHARLTAMESVQDAVLELLELALTWHELEYSETPRIPPHQWMAFGENRGWADPDRINRIFSVALDVAMTGARATKRQPAAADRQFWPRDAAALPGHVDTPGPSDLPSTTGGQRLAPVPAR